MCYAKPGPRCASHLASDLKKIDKELVTLEAESNDEWSRKLAKKRSERRILKFSYDGTPTGQNKIITALNAMGRNSPEYVDLESYRVKARSYYVAQKDKFKQMEQFRAMRQESLKRREAQNATASNNSPV